MLGSLGGPEIILIFVVALIVFGPKRLPEIGRKVGEVLRELRRATGDFRSSMEREIGFDPVTGVQQAQKARRDILSSVSDPIREVAQGTIGAVRDARQQADALIRAQQAMADPPASVKWPASGGPSEPAPQAAEPATQAAEPATQATEPATQAMEPYPPPPVSEEAAQRSLNFGKSARTKDQDPGPSHGGPVG